LKANVLCPSCPEFPAERGQTSIEHGQATYGFTRVGVAVDGELAYVWMELADFGYGNNRNYISVVDLSTPEVPQVVGLHLTDSRFGFRDIFVNTGFLVVGRFDGVTTFSLADPVTPQRLNDMSMPFHRAELSQKNVLVAASTAGFRIVDFNALVHGVVDVVGDLTGFSTVYEATVTESHGFFLENGIMRIANLESNPEAALVGALEVGNAYESLLLGPNQGFLVLARRFWSGADDGSVIEVMIIDVSTVEEPRIRGTVRFSSDRLTEMVLSGRSAFILDRVDGAPRLHHLSFESPDQPELLEVLSGRRLGRIAASEGFLYAFDFEAVRIGIFDIEDPTLPMEVGSIERIVSDIVIDNRRMYLEVGPPHRDIQVFSLNNPLNPVEIGSFQPGVGILFFDAWGPFLVTATSRQIYSNGFSLRVYDVVLSDLSDLDHPVARTVISGLTDYTFVRGFSLSGPRLGVSGHGLMTYDLRSCVSPRRGAGRRVAP